MRIVAGSLKGRRVSTKALGVSMRGGVLRPTSSKVRESIFNILGERVKGAVFIDLYAGTGAVGMEAMSRGAEKVYFVEADKRRAGEIEAMLSGCGCRAGAVIVKRNAKSFIREALESGLRADIIFLDPPYRTSELDEAMGLLGGGKLLKGDGVVMAEHLSKKAMPHEAGALFFRKSYKYGDTSLTLYGVGA